MTGEVKYETQTQKPEEEKWKGTLESVIRELGDFVRKAVLLGAVIAMPLAYTFIDPAHVRNAAVTAYTISAGRATSNLIQNRPALESIVKDGAIGTILSYPTAKAFEGFNQLETKLAADYGTAGAKSIKMGSWIFGMQPALTTGYTVLNYGIGKKFRENWWPRVKTTFKGLALPSAVNVGYLYQYGGVLTQMIVSAGLWYTFGLIQALKGGKGNIKNLINVINPMPYINAGVSVTYKLARNTFKDLYEAVYTIGSGIRDTFYKAATKQEVNFAH